MLAWLPHLEHLGLRGTRVTGAPFCVQYRSTFALFQTDSTLKEFAINCRGIRFLDVETCEFITAAGLAECRALWPADCRILEPKEDLAAKAKSRGMSCGSSPGAPCSKQTSKKSRNARNATNGITSNSSNNSNGGGRSNDRYSSSSDARSTDARTPAVPPSEDATQAPPPTAHAPAFSSAPPIQPDAPVPVVKPRRRRTAKEMQELKKHAARKASGMPKLKFTAVRSTTSERASSDTEDSDQPGAARDERRKPTAGEWQRKVKL